MATQIAEPSDLPAGSITDANANHFRVLVYEQDQNFAGIKTLGIGDWKSFLNFNGAAINNVATFVGIDITEYNYKSTTEIPLPEGVYSVIERINNVASQCGVQTNPVSPGVFTPLLDRIEELKDWVHDGWTDESVEPHKEYSGLLDRMSAAELNIDSIEEEIGSSSSSGSLTGRISQLEDTVGDSSNGLVKDVSDLKNTVGNSASGLVKDVSDIGIFIGDYTIHDPTISSRLNNLETKTGANSSYTDTNSIDSRLVAIETNTGVALADDYDVSTDGTLLQRIKDVESLAGSAYHYKGDIISCTGDTLNLSDGTITLTELKSSDKYTGYVYNIKPSSGDYIEIAGVRFNRGVNVAWVWKDGGNGYFDELGTAIDVSQITTLQRQVSTLTEDINDINNTLNEKFINNKNPSQIWNSTQITVRGLYLVTGFVYNPNPANIKLESFVGYFDNTGACLKKNDIYIESSNSIFSFDETTYIVSAGSTSVKVNITQIGNTFNVQ